MKNLKQFQTYIAAIIFFPIFTWAFVKAAHYIKNVAAKSDYQKSVKRTDTLYNDDSIYVVTTIVDTIMVNNDQNFKRQKQAAMGGK